MGLTVVIAAMAMRGFCAFTIMVIFSMIWTSVTLCVPLKSTELSKIPLFSEEVKEKKAQ